MARVTWEDFQNVVEGEKCVLRGGSAGVFFEDYDRHDGYWRYTWTHFSLKPNPEFVEVYNMGYN